MIDRGYYYLLPVDVRGRVSAIGDRCAREALFCARVEALNARLYAGSYGPARSTTFAMGSAFRQLLVAEHNLQADPLVILAVRNEMSFLAWGAE